MKGLIKKAFLSKIVHSHIKTVLLGNNMYVMTEEPCLPHSLSVVNTYTEMATGSGHVTIVIKNQTAVLIIIRKSIKVTRVVAVNRVPPVKVMPATLEKLDEMKGIQQTRMCIEHRKEMLLQQVDLSGLEGWSGINCMSTHTPLTEHHNIFLLEPEELGCMGLAKHEIRVVDDETFKERFQRIPHPMEEDVRAHMKEMLEVGAICPILSPWCNAIMLVRMKDKGLYFCIDLCKLNTRTKKDSYPLTCIQETIESLVGVGYFSCQDLKAGFLQIAMDEA